MVLSNFVREIFLKLDRKEKNFLGGIPFSSELEREINNYQRYLSLDKFARQRTRFGDVAYDQSIPVGYVCFTNLKNATPMKYEGEFIGLENPLTYVHCRQLVVDPEFRNKRIGTQLMNACLDFAMKNKKNVVGDVKVENKKMISLLGDLGFEEKKIWKTPKGSEMIRFFHE